MDGYALNSTDIVGASKESPATLLVTHKIWAGDAPDGVIEPGTAARIMTGAPVPPGADCIVRQEDTDGGETEVQIFAAAAPGQNRCPRGEDFHQGDMLLPRGCRVDSCGIAVAAAAGESTLCVYRRPKVALISTGDELCPLGTPLTPGKIYDSNGVYLSTRCRQLGCELVSTVQAGDNLDDIARAVSAWAGRADLILTTGGVSVGQKDLLPFVLEKLDAEFIFRGVDLKPGMPTMASLVDGTPVLSLSGNPHAAIALFELLISPFLAKCRGLPYHPRRRSANVEGGFPKKSVKRRMVWGRLEGDCVHVSPMQGNGQLSGGVGCNCMVDIPAGSGPLRPGDWVEAILLEEVAG